MARCFLTGVEFPVEDGFVINRKAVHALLGALRTRAESLDRLLAQLGPLDEVPVAPRFAGGRARKRHRMICKAVVDVLAPAFPEIGLFVPWPKLAAGDVLERMRLHSAHPLYGEALGKLTENEILAVSRLGRDVLHALDPRRQLSRSAEIAARLGICVRHRQSDAATIAGLVRTAVHTGASVVPLGVHETEAEAVALSLNQALRPASQPQASSGGHGQDAR